MRQLIEKRAGALAVPHKVVGRARLLGAICKVETGGWQNRQPNFEFSYWIGGAYFDLEVHKKALERADPVLVPTMSALTACSVGPFQVMYATARELGFRGSVLELADPRTNLEFAIRYLNLRAVAKMPGHHTEEEWVTGCADAYNTGNPRDTRRNPAYEADVLEAYRSQDLWEDFAELPEYYRGTW